MSDYPKRDLTPEHTKRGSGHDTFSAAPTHPAVSAAYAYVDRVVDAADLNVAGAPAWHGWALREAFLAGVSHAEIKRDRNRLRAALEHAGNFIAGFEGDEAQEGIDELLAEIRAAIGKTG